MRSLYSNGQISATARTAAQDNESFVSQVGGGNFGTVVQTGDQQTADLVQVSNQGTVLGNDAYQTQSNGAGTNTTAGVTGRNDAYAAQYGQANYVDQVQAGSLNVAMTLQGRNGAQQTENYAVQEQTGSQNYGYVTQESSYNFAHQRQTSSINTLNGGGQPASNNDNGNYAITMQGGGASVGTNGSNGQWSQTIQNGQNNRAIVSQDH
ncbi:MAG TPA: hypothetical protein VFO93_15790 [Hymenobacter sp.]|uniref:hypothetical protein n=1 Tax=Hymenobacter sp. TaxID=1898978 RepID=UPI002D81010D|nr:hypothetical protein [Hymenobacter sp.]HET9505005.1 hypothetical protein [Hymenobacter sp.]